MSCKTILAHADDSLGLAARVEVASRTALQEDAHLVGVTMTGVSPFIFRSCIVEKHHQQFTDSGCPWRGVTRPSPTSRPRTKTRSASRARTLWQAHEQAMW